MKSFAEFIVEANIAADAGGKRGPRKPGESLQDYMKRTRGVDVSGHADLSSDEKVRKSGKSRPGTQAAAQNTAQTRSSRTAPNRPYGGEYTPPDVDNKPSKGQRVKDAFNRGRQTAQNVTSRVKEKASKVNQAVRDFGSKAANTTPRQAAQSVKNAASSAKQGMKNAAASAKQTAKDVASKAYNASPKDYVNKAKSVASDVKTKIKYGRSIKPNTSTSALATRSSELAKAANSNPASGLKTGAALSGVFGTASEKSKGSGWARSLAKGATMAAGTVLGGIAGGSVAGPVGGYVGQAAGAAAADKAFDVVAGKNAKERAADRVKNRQRQAGGALVGTGGKTTFDTKKNTMTTGGKTVNLAKTSVVKDPKSGKTETGFLAYKGGKAVYKRADKPGTGSSNPFERIGRTINPNAYKANDAKLAAQKLNQAKSNDAARDKALGIKPKK